MASPYAHVLLAPWRQLAAEDTSWSRRIIYGLLSLIALGLLVVLPAPVRRVCAAVLACLVLAGLYTWHLSSLIAQNQPGLARLVPGHLRHLRRAALGLWAGLSLSSALLLWAVVPGLVLPLAWLAVAGLYLLLALSMLRWSFWIWIWFALPLAQGLGVWAAIERLLRACAPWALAQPHLTALAGLLALGTLLARSLGGGDAAHRRRYLSQQFSRQYLQALRQGAAPQTRLQTPWLERLAAPFDALANLWLAATLRRARPDTASVMQRADIVLHHAQHWLRHLISLCTIVGLALLALLTVWALRGTVFPADWAQVDWSQAGLGLSIGFVSLMLNPGMTLPSALGFSRREQALLRLLPGMPQGAALNRAVLVLQLRHAALFWLLGLAAALPVALMLDRPALLGSVCLTLPCVLNALLRAPATTPPRALAWHNIAGLSLCIGVPVLWLMLGWPLWGLALASLAICVALLALRLPRVIEAPAALPAGRLA